MNKTRRIVYQALAIALFVSVAVFRPIGIASGTLWAGILAVMVPYIGWRSAIVLVVAETLLFTFQAFSMPVLSNIFYYLPLISFGYLFFFFFTACVMELLVLYIGADISGIRRKLERIFP